METAPIVKRATEGDWLNVLGMKIQYLCTSVDTDGRYSSMLNTVPKGLGAPPHSHPWDEAFYTLKRTSGVLDRRRMSRIKSRRLYFDSGESGACL